jgi:hypothetical protein
MPPSDRTPVDHTPLVTAPTAVVGLLLEAVDHVTSS